MPSFQKHAPATFLFLLLLIPKYGRCQASDVTPEDCVAVRYVTGVWSNHKGTQIAYLLKVPNLDQNRNDFQLYVKDVNEGSRTEGRLLTTGGDISDVR